MKKRNADCLHCAANPWKALPLHEQHARKVEQLRAAFAGLPVEVPEKIRASPLREGFRASIKLVAGSERGRPMLGLYEPGSHRPLDASLCPEHSPLLQAVMQAFLRLWSPDTLPPWREASRRGVLKHLVCRAPGAEALAALVLALPADSPEPAVEAARSLARRLHEGVEGLAGVDLVYNPAKGNRVLGGSVEHVCGADIVEHAWLEAPVAHNSLAFMQANPGVYREILREARRRITADGRTRLADLYCGNGSIGLSLAEPEGELLLVERDPAGAVLLSHAEGRPGVTTAVAPAENSLQLLEDWSPRVLVVNPPRKGMDSTVVQWIRDRGPGEVFYLSCNPASLARDLKGLLEGYRVVHLSAWDMIPDSPHLECLVQLRRNHSV